ncbi:radical SAM family heme chaperone HemW [Candidatus Phycosocius spiralis]|uniref:Heme chaperone HemW n=1 Tax=Candidatus Phycosocius spiralis TaxID=2815099 RepID=A0ABQ4PTZ5_9PROT|nr:radical SAM family heme chaperone HemW [Candidatus Phycosocius spiralis]GIU66369.1 coproporphyrinogen III oxidase [Candidatus Phycosocius spiralis]
MSKRQLGLYLHWPYCAAICPYCDFNVYKAAGQDSAPLVSAILADMAYWRRETGPRALSSLFLGGGTPSLMDPRDVATIIEACDQLWGFAEHCEISLEANPTDGEAARFRDLRVAGVERLSLGLQALDDASLWALGRFHSAKEGLAAADLARGLFPRLSIDLIYSRQDQSLQAWTEELNIALAIGPDHISPYQLTIEAGTAFAQAVARGRLVLPCQDLAADFYHLTQDHLETGGFEAYEVSNHARGVPNRSRHNILYWTSQDWIGVGPGAHGRLGWKDARRATKAHERPKDYCQSLRDAGHGLVEDEILSPEAARDEFWLMGLRLKDGVAWSMADTDAAWLTLDPARIRTRVDQGYMWQTTTHLGLTTKGRLVADTIITGLLTD